MTMRGLRPGAHWRLAGLGLALGLAACGGGGSDGPGPVPVNEASLRAAQTSGLLAFFKDKIAERAAAGLPGTAITVPTIHAPEAVSSVVTHAGAAVFEPVAEEADLLKADGGMVYALHRAYATATAKEPPRLAAMARLADGSLQRTAQLALDAQFIPAGLHLASGASRLAVLAAQDPYAGRQTVAGAGGAQFVPEYSRAFALDVYAAARGTAPEPQRRLRIDGLLLGSRMVGNTLYVVSTWSPDLSGFPVPAGASKADVDKALSGLQAAMLLPTVRVDGGAPQALVTADECFVQPGNASLALQVTTLTAIDLGAAGMPRASRCFAGGSEALHLGAASVYLATSRNYRYGASAAGAAFPANSRTDVHKFALRPGQVEYRASGFVDGHLGWDARRLSGRLNEFQGDLRLVTFSGERGQSGEPPVSVLFKPTAPAALQVLREDPSQRVLARIGGVAIKTRVSPVTEGGQQVDAVAFAGPRAYASTFLSSDPTYVLDLSAPARPAQVGELPLSGAAHRFYALPQGWLLAVGRESRVPFDGEIGVPLAPEGVPIRLLDARDPARVRSADTLLLGRSGTLTGLDASRQALHLLQNPQGGSQWRVAFPARIYQPEANSRVGYQGAARLELDLASGKLAQLPTLGAVDLGSVADGDLQGRYLLGNDRSLQIDSAVYHLSGGQTFYLAGY